jgi:cytochrome c oxidase subunit I+III
MPGPSAWHVLAAVFTAGFFLLLTVQAYWPGVISGILAVICVIRWLWETDWPSRLPVADIGGGVRVPTYVRGSASHGWWGMVVLLIVTGMIFVMSVFSYVFLWSRRPELWIAPPEPIWLVATASAYLVAGALAALAPRVLRRARVAIAVSLTTFAAVVALVGWAADFGSWRAAGLLPKASSQGATVYALISFQGLLIVVAVLMAGFVAARGLRGHLSAERTSTVDLTALFFGYLAAQGALGAALVRLFPGG